jgi:hypothetical protein
MAIVPAGLSRPVNDDRLAGHAPALEIDDAGDIPDVRVSPFTGTSEFVPSA